LDILLNGGRDDIRGCEGKRLITAVNLGWEVRGVELLQRRPVISFEGLATFLYRSTKGKRLGADRRKLEVGLTINKLYRMY